MADTRTLTVPNADAVPSNTCAALVSNTDCTLPGMFGLKSNAPQPANPGANPTSMTGVDPGLMSLKNIG